MPYPLGPILGSNEPVAVIHCIVSTNLALELLNRIPDSIRALPPLPQGRNVLDGVARKPGPPPAYLQNPAVFIMDDEWNRRLGYRPIQEPGNVTPEGR